VGKCHLVPEIVASQDLLNSARSRAEKKNAFIKSTLHLFVINKMLTFSSRSQGSIQPNKKSSFENEEKRTSEDVTGKESTNDTK